MTFQWPIMLSAVLLLPISIVIYLKINRRRQDQAASMIFGKTQAHSAPGFRRHIPPLLFLIGLTIVLLALARPQAEISLPRIEGTVMLVMDVSASMGATDVEPSRLDLAKSTAREFVLSQPETVRIGLVTFSSSGFTIEPPTHETNNLLSAIDRLQPTTGTSLGQGILTALHTIAIDAGLLAPDQIPTEMPSNDQTPQLDPRGPQLLALLPDGIYPSAVIVVLSDGENNFSIDPVEVAAAAGEHGVRIDALGFGTSNGTNLEVGGFLVHTALDEAVLHGITSVSGGTYYAAQEVQDPKAVYANLSPRLVTKPEKMELTSLFTGASIAFLLIGSIFSMIWFNRILWTIASRQ